jgi:hypothetical protein
MYTPIVERKGLSALVREEKIFGVNGSGDENYFKPLTGYFVLIEDSTGKHKQIVVEEYEYNNASDLVPPWPQNPYTAMVNTQNTTVAVNNMQRGNEGLVGGVGKEQYSKNENHHGNGEEDFMNLSTTSRKVLVPNTNASGLINSIAGQSKKDRNGTTKPIIDKRVNQLIKRVVGRKAPVPPKVEEKVEVQTTKSLTTSHSVRLQPEGKNFYNNSGKCENCNEHYDNFKQVWLQ